MSHVMRICVVSATMLVALLSSPAVAMEVEAATLASQPLLAAPNAVEAAAPAPRANPLGVKALDAMLLGTRRGRADVLNDMQLKGVVTDTRAINVSTGNNTISDGALAGAAGLPMVVQNTGNNVLIQNATIINIQVK